MTGYIYVLHFETPLSHARHYVGCTTKIEKRLSAHAVGAGSRLTRELRRQGIAWHLASLFCCSRQQMRRIERKIKNCHGGGRYCETCQGNYLIRPEGTTPYPVAALPFATSSLKIEGGTEPRIVIRETGPSEPVSVCSFILAMMQEAKGQAGFIPVGGTGGLTATIQKGQVLIAELNGIHAGYLSYGLSSNGTDLTIHQVIVDDAWHGMGIGRALVEYVANKHPTHTLRCTVKATLAANEFWKAIGFTELGERKHHSSGEDLIPYFRSQQRIPPEQGGPYTVEEIPTHNAHSPVTPKEKQYGPADSIPPPGGSRDGTRPTATDGTDSTSKSEDQSDTNMAGATPEGTSQTRDVPGSNA